MEEVKYLDQRLVKPMKVIMDHDKELMGSVGVLSEPWLKYGEIIIIRVIWRYFTFIVNSLLFLFCAYVILISILFNFCC